MNFVKYVLILLCVYSLNSFAWSWGKYDGYECPTSNAASSCNSTCKKDKTQYEFKVSEIKNIVMILYYEGGKNVGTATFENCNIIDSQNWSCGKDSRSSMVRLAMKNGVFDYKNFDLTGRLSDYYLCAIK